MKFVSKKSFASSVLAGAMALSMVAPALAADTNTTTITGKYEPITLAVTVPQTGSAIINPYGLPVELDEDNVISGQQITTGAPLVISNQSKVALAVSAKITGTEKGTFKFDASAVGDSETANKGNVLFEAFPAPGVLDDADEADLNEAFAALKSADAKLTATLAASEVSTTGTLVLREGEDGETQDGGAAFIRLSGTVAKAPTQAWVAADGFEAKVVFSFEPSEYVGTVQLKAANDATEVAVESTLDISVVLPAGVKVDTKQPVKWTSSKDANVTVVSKTATATELKGTATGVKAGTVTVDVEFVGTDGVTYKGSMSLKATA